MTDEELAAALHLSLPQAQVARQKADRIVAIQKAQIASGLSHRDLAERSGLTLAIVVGILGGSREDASLDELEHLARAAGV